MEFKFNLIMEFKFKHSVLNKYKNLKCAFSQILLLKQDKTTIENKKMCERKHNKTKQK